MPIEIPTGQFWSELIGDFVWVLVGAGLLYFWPRLIHRKIESGKLTEEDGEASLRRIPPKLGYVLIIVGIGLMIGELYKAGFLGHSKLLALLPATISVGLIVFWLRQRRNSS